MEMNKQIVEVPGSPSIKGLSFRMFNGEADFPIMLDLINRSKAVDKVERADTLDDLKRRFKHTDNFDSDKDMLFAEAGDEAIAYGQVRWYKEMDGPYLHNINALVAPEWRRKGIGTAMLRYFEARHRQISEEKGHADSAETLFEVYTPDTQVALLTLLEKEGYTTARYFFEMARPHSAPVPKAPLPEGLEVRPVEDAHIDVIYAAMDEAFQDHWGYVPFTENMIQQWKSEPEFDPNLWQVAWDGDQVAGMVLNFISKQENLEYKRQRGYTEDICVRRPWRKRGLAKALLAQSILMFNEMGMQETALSMGVQNPNGALGLYEGMGYAEIKQYRMYRKPMG